MILLTVAVAALAQEAPVTPSAQPGTTVPAGVPLRVALERRVAIKRAGEPIQGRLVDAVYVFDRAMLPAGSIVEGHIAEIGGVPFRRRLTAILSGNLTPPREVRAQFDALVLSDGSRLSLRTFLSRGTAHATSPKTRFIFPAIAMAVAGLSFHQDYNAQGVPDRDMAGRAESGAVGLGLIGTLLAQASRTLASSIAFTGAGFSVYSTFIARGEDVVLPVNTPVKVSLGARGDDAGGGQPAKVVRFIQPVPE
jgi:hypothetical protein